jgi:mRNA interferase RelE/StbE
VELLSDDPRPHGALRLSAPFEGMLRLRVGDYRISYSVDNDRRVIDVWRIGHRSTFYKRLRGK